MPTILHSFVLSELASKLHAWACITDMELFFPAIVRKPHAQE